MNLTTNIMNKIKKNLKTENIIYIITLTLIVLLALSFLTPAIKASKEEICSIKTASENYVINFSDIEIIDIESITFISEGKSVSLSGDYDLDCIKK